jgi:hypothetical protein
MRRLTVTLPDPDSDPITFDMMDLSDGGYAFVSQETVALTADEMLALGTALKRWEAQHVGCGEVTAQEHAEACSGASQIGIGVIE